MIDSGSKKIIVLGSTGSIGMQTLDVLRKNSNHYQVFALTAYNSVEKIAHQCLEFKPRYAILSDKDKLIDLQALLQKYKLQTPSPSANYAQ